MPGDLKVSMAHAVPSSKHRRAFLRARTEADAPQHMESVEVEITVRDARKERLRLDETSFELLQHPTKLSTTDFYDGERISTDYYEEMKVVLSEATGCLPEHMLAFHHQVRNQERANSRVQADGSITTNTPVQPYAHSIHTDSSPFHGEEFCANMVAKMPECCRRGRFLYVNVWRNIADEPIEDNHLAVLDERSLVKPDDYIQTDLHGTGFDVLQYNLSARNAGKHRWWYYPQMRRDEVLLFKQWDSDPDLQGRLCFHTAIKDPTARADAPARQSIEVRVMCFFPDHEPNTLPPELSAPAPTDAGELSVSQASSGVEKVIGGLQYVESHPETRAMVVGFMSSMYKSGGARSVLEAFCEDAQSHFGLKTASSATKAKAVELLLERGAAKRVDAIFSGPSAARLLLTSAINSRTGSMLVGGVAALALRALVARARA